jgi:hypothetical protein
VYTFQMSYRATFRCLSRNARLMSVPNLRIVRHG